MIFLQGQSQDNASADPFVLDGRIVPGENPQVRAALGCASEVRLRGRAAIFGDTMVWRFNELVGIEIHTNETDRGGRPAPLVATVDWSSLDMGAIPELVDRLGAYANLINRSFDAFGLRHDLESWRLSPKARRGRLMRLYRRFLGWPKALLGRFRPVSRASDGS